MNNWHFLAHCLGDYIIRALYISKISNITELKCLSHITSSPRYPQSNGFIERMVQTVKQCMRKCAAAGHDPNLAMLIYRATPLTTSIPSPAELLNGRRYRALLPTRSPIQNPHCQVVREQMVKDKDKMCEHYNKTARDLPSLPQNQRVYVQVHPSVANGPQQPLPKRQ